MDVELMPPQALPPRLPHTFFDVLDPLTRALPRELGGQIREPFWLDAVGRSGLMEIRVDLGFGVLRFVTRRSLAYDANVHIFILWMLGASIVLLVVAILFLRNQVRPILRLAAAAEDFGKGRDLEFQPRGAREVRQAGYAFIEMKRRIERAAEQRMTMLNGVSHDLRTILTRFRLSLAMIEDSTETEPLQQDVDEMQAMLEGYLAFARGDGGELTMLTNLRSTLEELRAGAARHGGRLSIEAKGDLNVKVRPLAMKRCVGNLLANAQRYGDNVIVAAGREQRFVTINVDDDGPGIAPEHRENVFRPFLRLDEARTRTRAVPVSAWRSLATSPAPTAATSSCLPAPLEDCGRAFAFRSERTAPRLSRRIDSEDQFPRHLARRKPIEHFTRLLEWEHGLDVHLQPSPRDAAHDFIEASTPFVGAEIDMTEMEAREGERLRHQPLPEIGQRAPFGFAVAHDVSELSDAGEAAVENAGARGVDELADAPAPSERHDGGDEILILAIDDQGRATFERALFLSARADRADHGRPRLHRQLRREQAETAADRMQKDHVPSPGHADIA